MKSILRTIYVIGLVCASLFFAFVSIVRAIDIPVFSPFEKNTTSITASWAPIPGAIYYNVSSTAGGQIVKTTDLSAVFGGLTPSAEYVFQIEAVDEDLVSSGYSTPAVTYTSPRIPVVSGFGSITTSSLQVSWGSLAEAVYYTVSSTAGTVTTTDTSYEFSDLTPNSMYVFQVQAHDQWGQESGYSAVSSTITDNLPTLPPPLIGGFTETTSTVSVFWDTITGASYYVISRATSQTVVAETITLGTGTDSDHTLPINRFYNYSVSEMVYLASEVGGIAGPISSVSFYKQSGSAVPTISDVTVYLKHTAASTLATGNASTNGYSQVYAGSFPNTVSSGWVGVSTTPFYYNGTDNLSVLVVHGYELFTTERPYYRYTATPDLRARYYYSDDTAFSSGATSLIATPNRPNIQLGLPTVELGGDIVTVTTTETEYLFTGLSPSTTYYFQVYAVDEIDQSGTYSMSSSTYTETPPPPVVPVVTDLVPSTSTFSVTWDTVYGAIFYTVSSTAGTVTTTEVTHVFSGLSPSSTYYVQVQAHDAYTQVSGFSDTTSTATDITPIPEIPVITDSVKTTSSISIFWDTVTYATFYTVSSTAGTVTTTDVSYVFTGLMPPSTTWYFQVSATDQFGRSSDFSDVFATTTDSLDPPATPVVSALVPTYSTVYVGWDAVTGGVYYTVSSTAGTVTTTATHYVFTGLSASTTYYFQVKATNVYDQDSEYTTVTSTRTGSAPSFVEIEGTISTSTFSFSGTTTTYIVPDRVTSIIIDAYGAGGGGGGVVPTNAGSGARMRGAVPVTPGEELRILVGGSGGGNPNPSSGANSGGGGSFVVRAPYNTLESVLVVAGGGGGHGTSANVNRHGQTTTSGGSGGGAGGTDGSGGFASGSISAGGGFLTNGGGTTGGYSFVSGLSVGTFTGCVVTRAFGGGGGGSGCTSSGGGGGGYSGGGAGSGASGGGGGSIINGTTLSATAGGGSAPNSHGQIIITAITDPVPSFSASVSSVSGYVTMGINVDDSDNDPLKISYRYAPGTCAAYTGVESTMTLIGTPSSTYGQGSIVFDNSTTTGYQLSNITTASGSNLVTTVWDSKSQLPLVENEQYCIYVEVSDGDGISVTTSTVTLDNLGRPSVFNNATNLGDPITFAYTGDSQTYTVPSGVYSLNIEAWGAQGGDGSPAVGGLGGYSSGRLSVTPGQEIYIYVGQKGIVSQSSVRGDAFNGGGTGFGTGTGTGARGGGGGASDVRTGMATSTRVIVAGGGGGSWSSSQGGAGGGLVGASGIGASLGGGGTQSAGGSSGFCSPNGAGSLGQGGRVLCTSTVCGGGGGYYGGGAGNSGGGGSSYIGGVTFATTTAGVRSGNGEIIITPQVTVQGGVVNPLQATAVQDGSGHVVLSMGVNDLNQDALSVSFRYRSGSCIAYNGTQATTTLTSTVTSTYGQESIVLNNTAENGYQLGNVSTASGENIVTVYWDSKSQVPSANGTHCLYAFVHDGTSSSTVVTTTVVLDNVSPSQPTISSFTSITPVSLTVNWGAISGAVLYTVSSTAGTVTTTLTTRSFTGLTPTTTYLFQVFATDSYGNTSTFSTVSSTKTLPVSTPSISSFSNVTISQIQVNWGAQSGAVFYTVSSTAGTVTTTATNRLFTGLDTYTPYYFQVSATDINGNMSAFSSTMSTSTALPVQLSQPAIDELSSSTTTIQIGWNSIDGAAYYLISRSTSSTGQNNSLIIGTSTTTYNHSLAILPIDRFYNYSASEMIYLQSELGTAKDFNRIEFYKDSGSASITINGVSIYMRHTTGSTLVSGTTNLTGYTQVYSGSFPNSVENGWVGVDLNNTFAYNGTNNLQLLVVKDFEQYVSPPSTSLYRYSVSASRARSYRNDTIPWGTGVTLAVTSSRPNIRLTDIERLSGTIATVTTTETSYLISNLSPSTTYYFTVNAVDQYHQIGVSSTVSSTYTQTPPPPATPVITTSTNTTTTIQLSWGSVYGAVYYTVSSTLGTVTTTATNRLFTGLTPSTTHSFQVMAHDAYNQTSTFSGMYTTSTPLSAVASAPGITGFSNVTSSTIQVSWQSREFIAYYTVSSTAGTVTTTNLYYYFGSVTPSTTYYFQVRATDIWGRNTAYSAVSSQSTPKPSIPATPSINDFITDSLDTQSTINVLWDPISGAAYYTLYWSTTVSTTQVFSGGAVMIGTATTSLSGTTDFHAPIDRYYEYSAFEMLYLPGEIGASSGATITSTAFYKTTGTSGVAVSNVTIYFKHTTSTAFLTSTSTTNLVGYTQVWSGSFPNSGTVGWQQVVLNTPFVYNGTSTLSMLVVKGYEPWVASPSYPVYASSSTVQTLARGWRLDGSAWTANSSVLTSFVNRPKVLFTGSGFGMSSSTFLLNSSTVTTTDSNYIVTGLTPSTTYYFQMTVTDQYAQTSATSTIMSTTTPPAPSPSSTVITALSRTTSTITVEWIAASGAGYYFVSSTAGAVVTTTATSYTFTGLTHNSLYYFQVQPSNSYGVTTTYSAVSSTYTYALPPSVTSFAWPTSSSIQVAWSTVTGTAHYTVSSTAGTVTTTQTSHTFAGLTPNTSYRFQVRSNISDYSSVSSTDIIVGTFISDIVDTGHSSAFGAIEWDETVPAGSFVAMEIRAGNQSDLSDGVWTGVSSGDELDTNFDGRRYYQYRATMFASDPSEVPSVEEVRVGHYGQTAGSLISSPFDTGSSLNLFAGIEWDAHVPSSTALKFQVRTSPDNSVWTDWAGPDGTSATYFTDSSGGQAIPTALADGVNDRWLQYRAFLEGDGTITPTLFDVTLIYTVNAIPEIMITNEGDVVQSSDGSVVLTYAVRDTDTVTGATPGSVSVDLQYCTSNCESGGSETWVTAVSTTVVGDVGPGIVVNTASSSEYMNYSLTWYPKLSYPNQYHSDFKIRLRVNDGEAANNIGSSESNIFTLDTTDPVIVSVTTDARNSSVSSSTVSLLVSDDTMSGLEMKFSNNADLSDDGVNVDSGVWVPYVEGFAWLFSGNPARVYYQLRDAYGNVSDAGDVAMLSTLASPRSFVYQDVSNAAGEDWREFLAWEVVSEPLEGFRHYILYRSTDGENYSPILNQTDRTINYYIDQGLDTELTYYYKLSIEDTAGNISSYTNVISDTPDGQGGSDIVPPLISNVIISDVTTDSFMVSWDTNELANSFIDYITIMGGDFSDPVSVGSVSFVDHPGNLGEHRVVVSGLTPNTNYYFQVRSADISGNVATSTLGDDGYVVSTLAGPTISNLGVLHISNTKVAIAWETDELSSSYVYYSNDRSMISPSVAGNTEDVTSHTVVIDDLLPGTTYYYYVKSGTAEDRNIVGGEIRYHTFTTLNDQIAPVITFDPSIDVIVSDTQILLTWSTSEPATSVVEYGTSTLYGSSISNTDLNTNHSHVISGLTLGTAYHVRFQGSDLNGNTSIPVEFVTTTSDSTDYDPPIITNATTTVITDDQAMVTWQTNEGAAGQVWYGLSSSTLASSTVLNVTYNRSHSALISELATSTSYYYVVVVQDFTGNMTTSSVLSFTTREQLSEESEVLLREEIARAEALANAPSRSSNTGSGYVPDVSAPTILTLSVLDITGSSARFVWNTDELGDSAVEFGVTTVYNKAGVNWEQVLQHEIKLVDLVPLTTYHYRVSSADASGNRSAFVTGMFTTSLIEDIEDTVPSSTLENPEEESEISPEPEITEEMFLLAMQRAAELIKSMSTQVSVGVLEDTLLSQTQVIQELSSLLPRPVIGGQPVVEETANSAVIKWTTDKDSNSLVEYAPEAVYRETGVFNQTVGDPFAFTGNHTIQLYGLIPSTEYRYRIISRTPTGAETVSRDFLFTTRAQTIEISTYRVNVVSPEEAVFSWTTTLPTDSSISYTPYRDGVLALDARQIVQSDSVTTQHTLKLTGLEGGVLYDVELSGRDSGGNTVTKLIQGFSTEDTDVAPVITQIKTDSSIIPGAKERIQVIISWMTNELSTSRVLYRNGYGSPTDEFTQSTQLDTNYTKKHVVVVTNFEPGSIYQFQVESTDSSGNTARSKTVSVLTPRKEESVFQVILGNFEDIFSWVGRLRR